MDKLSMTDIEDRVAAAGGNWFSSGTMKYWRSSVYRQTVLQDGTGFTLFVSSELHTPHIGGARRRRLYTIRAYKPESNTIRTVSEFGEFGSLAQATKAMYKMAEQ